MSKKEQWISLDQAATFSSGGTPSKANSDYWDGDIPWVSAKDMKTSRIFDAEDHISEAGLANGSSLAPAGATLVLVRGMTLLNDVPICLATRDVAFNQDVKALVPRDGVVGTYLNYAIHAAKPTLLSAVDLAGHGTGKLPTDIFKSVQIRLPQEAEQRAVSHILGGLDDKIELNRRMNEALEMMARAIFKSWFVDFDPVRAKASGEPEESICQRLSLTPEVVALFPKSIQRTVYGEVPQGWPLRPLPDVIEINPRYQLRKTSLSPYLDMSNVPTNTSRVTEVVMREFSSGSKFANGDTLLARITPCLENGKTAFVDFLETDQVGWGSTEFIVLRPKLPLPLAFAYFLCRQPEFRAFAIGHMAGTSGRQRVPNDCFSTYYLPVASANIYDAFGQLMHATMGRIKALDTEAKTLAKLRDTLLPKLLSGELGVPMGTAA